MPTWQITVLLAMAGCAVGCLLGLCIAIERLVKGISCIGAELAKMNAKLQMVQARNEDDTSLDAIEAALSNFEKLKRIDSAKPQV